MDWKDIIKVLSALVTIIICDESWIIYSTFTQEHFAMDTTIQIIKIQ